MTTLYRAVLKAYDAGAHKANVQLAGSLSVWLENVPVATDIPAAEMIAERECAVLFFTDDNPDDAVVVTVHGAAPSLPTRISDADADTYVETELTADEDKVRVVASNALRGLFQTASPHVQLNGDVEVNAVAALTGFVVKGSASGLTNIVLDNSPYSGGKKLEWDGTTGEMFFYNRTDDYYIWRHNFSSKGNTFTGNLQLANAGGTLIITTNSDAGGKRVDIGEDTNDAIIYQRTDSYYILRHPFSNRRTIFPRGIVIGSEQGGLSLANGNNNNVDPGGHTHLRITGPTAAFTITGLIGSENSRLLILHNASGQNMTIAHENAGSSASYRIKSMTGANRTTTGDGVAVLLYSAADSRWLLLSIDG